MNAISSPLFAKRCLGAALALTLASCGHPKEKEIRIGLLHISEGQGAVESGAPSLLGADMAVDELNAEGGVLIGGTRYRVRLLKRGYVSGPDAAASAAREVINLDSADALVGPQLSSHALTAATVAELAGVPMITPMASNPNVTKGKTFVFRLAFLDAFQGQLLAGYAADKLHLRRASILYDATSAYGHDIADLFRQTFESRGGKVVATETFVSDGGFDYRPQLRRILAKSPDALLLPNYARQDSFQVRQARELGFRGRFLGSDNWDPVSVAHIPEASGTVLVSQWDERIPREETQAFLKRYAKRYPGGRPRTTAASTYDAVRVLADAASRAGTLEGKAWAKAIGGTPRFEGVVAVYRFVGTGDPKRGGSVLYLGPRGDSLLATQEPPE